MVGMLHLIDERFAFYDLEDKFETKIAKSKHFNFGHEGISSFNRSYRMLLSEVKKRLEAIQSTHLGIT